ncbi:hypothetical protein [Iodidimonas sp. SYSU 1G8]|uniref:DUF7676 family protein n=1 Tax=Iodidimonas sp. SYSU 1G8 TaxID=3133967 RepID=UPI0031FF30AA
MTQPIPMVSIIESGATEQVWPLPLDEAFLERLLRDLFENHYAALTFGPLIPGAAYEMKAPGAPERVSCQGGYLTVHWGGKGHFHLCIGTNRGPASNPNPPELIAHRRPSRAEFFRRLDKQGHPVSWGYRMFNGKGEPQITIFFANPFITDADQLADAPDWSRLATWDAIMADYAGHQPDGLDRLGKGFRGA